MAGSCGVFRKNVTGRDWTKMSNTTDLMDQKIENGLNPFFPLPISDFSNDCPCGQPSEYGCHGVRDGEVYSEYFCKKCKNAREE